VAASSGPLASRVDSTDIAAKLEHAAVAFPDAELNFDGIVGLRLAP
jgi:hypothetical protein